MSLRLTELQPRWLRYEVVDGHAQYAKVESIAEAQGIRFMCPACWAKNAGPVGTHQVVCWSRSRGTPDSAAPGPGRWSLHGTSFEDLTLNGDAPGGGGARSVQLTAGCRWHGFITAGEVTTC